MYGVLRGAGSGPAIFESPPSVFVQIGPGLVHDAVHFTLHLVAHGISFCLSEQGGSVFFVLAYFCEIARNADFGGGTSRCKEMARVCVVVSGQLSTPQHLVLAVVALPTVYHGNTRTCDAWDNTRRC